MPAETGLTVRVAPTDPHVQVARARLVEARQHTRDAFVALRQEVAVQTDWHTWYRARTGLLLAAAFATGFLLAKRRRFPYQLLGVAKALLRAPSDPSSQSRGENSAHRGT